MANTRIQVKRSTVTNQPSSLAIAEPAYSYLSNTLFLGTSDGNGVLPIGGHSYTLKTNSAYDIAIAAYEVANAAAGEAGADIAIAAFDKANSANLLAYNTGIGVNAYMITVQNGSNTAVGAGANAFASATIAGANTAVGAGANSYAAAAAAGANAYMISVQNGSNTAVGTGANAFTSATIAGANTAVGTGANAYAAAAAAGANAYMISVQNGSNTAVGTGANAFASATISGANTAVGTGANTYANGTFVKLTAPQQTITGNLSITGSLSVAGNTFLLDTETLRISDPLLYLAGNNYVSDTVDIGFVANYVNTTGQNVHTGFFREHVTKEYYLFQGYDKEPDPNHIDITGNNFTLAVLNAGIRTSNLSLGGQNAIVWITSSFDKANAANVLAYNTGIGANAFTSATIAGANTAVGAGANAYATAAAAGANAYMISVQNGSNTAVGTGANAFTSATIAGANTAVGTGANAYAAAAAAGANAYMISVQNGSNTAVGAGANAYAAAAAAGANAYAAVVGAAANTNASNASYLSIGTVPSARITGSYIGITGVGTITAGVWNGSTVTVPYGGTGATSFTANGILYGDGTNAIKVTAQGADGNVLQSDANGRPFFGMLDGGSF